MNHRTAWLGWFLLLALPVRADQVSGSLPPPPEQNQAWTVPATALPDSLISAAGSLFQEGLADPRGCEYRAVELRIGSHWEGDAGVFPTRGWVLPARPGESNRFAVGWNGLVYPVVSIGSPADLRKELSGPWASGAEPGSSLIVPPSNWQNFGWTESLSLSNKTDLPIKVVLLLRLGQADLAEKLWAPFAKINGPPPQEPYLTLAAGWLWTLFDRTVSAHMGGDDRLALSGVRALVPIRKAVIGEALRRGWSVKEMESSYLHFLSPLPALAADQERRALEPHYEPAIQVGLDKFPTKSALIAALIRDLENVSRQAAYQPDPTVQALLAQGDQAVEPLLACLENDTRLTRSAPPFDNFDGNPFGRQRRILGVQEVAYLALVGILKTTSFGVSLNGDELITGGMAGRQKVADAIRTHWKKYHGVPLEERWYQTLADDGATVADWAQAIHCITLATDVMESSGSRYGTVVTMPFSSWPETTHKLRGESLRDQRKPSVTELMIKRIDELAPVGKIAPEQRPRFNSGCQLAYGLAVWDPSAARPVLQRLTRSCRDDVSLAPSQPPDGWGLPALSWLIVKLVLVRDQCGDATALDDYATWLRTVHPRDATGLFGIFEPMWRHPDDPAIAAAARALFNDPQSTWADSFSRSYDAQVFLESPMIGVPAFRQWLLGELADQHRSGSLRMGINGSGRVELDNGQSLDIADPDDSRSLKPGAITSFRVCDWYGWELSKLTGAPRCELGWPEARRDAAVAASAAFLSRYGDRFRFSPATGEAAPAFRAAFHLPRLDKPASREQLTNGLAIFSLAGADAVRLTPLPAFPIAATRHTNEFGNVWQAEEVFRNGQWERFYGFVGPNQVAQSPAAEIEFPGDSTWTSLAYGLDCRLETPGRIVNGDTVSFTRLGVGAAVPMTLRLRNRSGLDQDLSPSCFQVASGAAQGWRLQLWYSPEKVSATGGLVPRAVKDADWQEIKPKAVPPATPVPAIRHLTPAAEVTALQLDLNDWFDLGRSGAYRLQAVFLSVDPGAVQRVSNQVEFSLAER